MSRKRNESEYTNLLTIQGYFRDLQNPEDNIALRLVAKVGVCDRRPDGQMPTTVTEPQISGRQLLQTIQSRGLVALGKCRVVENGIG